MSRAGRIAALAVIALAQVTLVWGRLGAPFLDTRLHYYWDDAFLSFNARSGNRSGALRDQFGITRASWARWGVPAGAPGHYTDHPFLVPALFQQTARVTGTGERAIRSFSALVSFGIAAGLFLLVLQATGDLFAALLAGLVLVSLPLFATFQVSAKYETDGMLFGVWQAVALGALLRRPTVRSRATFIALTALSFLAHWTSALSAGLLGLFLVARLAWRRDVDSRRAVLSALAGAIGGVVLLGAVMVFVQGGVRAAWEPLRESFSRRSESVPWVSWAARQWIYLGANFGWPVLAAACGITGFLVFRRKALVPGEILLPFISVSASTGVAWMLFFREGSAVHVYWQYWLALPVAGLVGAFVAALSGFPRARIAAGAALVLLCVHLRARATETRENIESVQLGMPEDIEFLKSLREDRFTRLVFVPLTEDPFNEWFQGPLFEYYTDRPVAIIDPEKTPPKGGEKLLILAIEERSAALAELEARFGRRFTGEKCGPRFCAYDIGEP